MAKPDPTRGWAGKLAEAADVVASAHSFRDVVIRRALEAGVPAAEVARHVGLTRQRVHQIARG